MNRNRSSRNPPIIRLLLLMASLIFVGMDASIAGEARRGVPESNGAEKNRSKEGGKGMRWKFGGKGDKEYQAYRAEMSRRIDDWWKAFARDEGKIVASFKKGSDWDLPRWMAEHLHAIDERIMWEYGPGLKGGHRLVITPESDRFLRPLVSTILERAPKIAGWEFYPYRLAEDFGEARAMLKARDLMPIDATKVRATPGKNHLVDLHFHSPDYAGPEDREALNSVFIASEVILGEEMLDTWIGRLTVTKEKDGEAWVGLDRMKAVVEQEIARIRDRLPDKPAGKLPDDTKWTLWNLKPQKEEDYSEQEDLFVGRSMLPDMWTAAHSDCDFTSTRFTKFGELFCYVKLDGSVDLPGEKFPDKAAIEDALDRALKASGAGAVVGGGTGLRYSYVDLALTDPEKGIQQVVDVLRKGNVVKRTWILFFDDIYSAEWVGIWDDSPAPPGME
jgi:hypothetical protein